MTWPIKTNFITFSNDLVMKTTAILSSDVKEQKTQELVRNVESIIELKIPLAFVTFYQKDGDTMTWVYEDEKKDDLRIVITRIQASPARKPISDSVKAFRSINIGSVKDYATGNSKEQLVLDEIEVLTSKGGAVDTSWYFAFPWQDKNMAGYVFLLSDNSQEHAAFEKNLKKIVNLLNRF